MLSFESMALINSQEKFQECEICLQENLNETKKYVIDQLEEQTSKISIEPFRYNQLPDVMKYYISEYLNFLELVRLASTQKVNRYILKNIGDKHSPYLIAKIRSAKSLTPEDIYSYVNSSGMIDAPTFFKEARSLIHFIALDEGSYYNGDKPHRKNKYFLTTQVFRRILTCCPTIRHLTLDFCSISKLTLNSIAEINSNLQHLTLLGDITSVSELPTSLSKFKELEFLAIRPTTYVSANQISDTLQTKEIAELLDRNIHIKLLPETV